MIKPPFARTGGKQYSYQKILELFPEHNRYVEVFGGSGVVLLNKKIVPFEVFNDIEKGLIEFYKCLQDHDKMVELKRRLDLTIHSREYWNWCKDKEEFCSGIDRAFCWYYTFRCSFGQQGRAFGRSIGDVNQDSKKLMKSLPGFDIVHRRMRNVMVENQGFRQIIREFDREDTLFYLDPPYLDTFKQCYKHKMTLTDHKDLIKLIKKGKGKYVVSGYASELYDSQDFWTGRYSWKQDAIISGTYRNNDYNEAEEVVWLKENT